MRTNSNKKVHKIKRDPYKLLLRFLGILTALIVVGAGVYYLCSMAVTNDYVTTRQRITKENEQGAVEFNTHMNELRAQNQMVDDQGSVIVQTGDLPYWESEMEGVLWRVQDEGAAGLENTRTITMNRAQLMNGGLLLVNAWHTLPDDFSEEGLLVVGTTGDFKVPVQDSSVQLFQPAFDALVEALKAAKEEAGLEHFIVREGYRSVAAQEQAFNDEMQKLSSRYSNERLINETKKNVNYPGTSDYHTGLTFRMDVYEPGVARKKFQAESEQGKWLTENCWKYGIVFRFPSKNFPNESWEDKSYKTGISAQLNMYRYVGKAHSAAMRVMGLCLEEYIEFLMAHPHISIYENGALAYEIVRIKGASGTDEYSLPVPNPASGYQASLDNMDGIVMAYTYQN